MNHCEQELSVSVCPRDPETLQIKEEDHELCATRQHKEVKAKVEEFEDACDSHQPQSPACREENGQEDTRPALEAHRQNGGSGEHLEDLQEEKSFQYNLPLTLTLQVLDQDGRERPTASFTNQTQTDPSASFVVVSRESADLFQLSSAAPGYHCRLCDKSFLTNNHLVNHAFCVHSKNADAPVAVCQKTSESTKTLGMLLKSQKGSKCCHVCGKHYNSKTSLTEHMASHAGVKLHRCHVCGKECGRKGDLKIHMRIHTGEKPFCCSYCQKSFTHNSHLRKHMRVHTGERPYQCSICGKGFLQSTHLKYHLSTHTQKSWLFSRFLLNDTLKFQKSTAVPNQRRYEVHLCIVWIFTETFISH